MKRGNRDRNFAAGLCAVLALAGIIWGYTGMSAARAAASQVQVQKLQVSSLQAQVAAARARAKRVSGTNSPQHGGVPRDADEAGLIALVYQSAVETHSQLRQVTFSQASGSSKSHSAVHVSMQASARDVRSLEALLHTLEFGQRQLNPTVMQVTKGQSDWTVSVEYDAPYGP